MKIISYEDKDFSQSIKTILNKRGGELDAHVEELVKKIIVIVKQKGDKALFELTNKYDRIDLNYKNVKIPAQEIKSAYKKVPPKNISALKKAASRIKSFHLRQKETSWKKQEATGAVIGQIIKPLSAVGLYVPGGKATYPSSVLMNAIPAKIAGVKRIILCTPTPRGAISPYVLIASDIAGVDEIYRIGGAQAVAAMTYGTESIPKVDKIVGPGNIYVTTAKKLVFGVVDIDMIAGPSEIFIISDESGTPEFIAADLISQAEHDEYAIPILATTSNNLAINVISELSSQGERSPRRDIIKKALRKNCKILLVKNLKEAVDISNDFAPEHLELSVKNPNKLLKLIENAGAVFLGHFTPEAVGDYAAGPNHVLPTGGTARFSSPLGVYDFYKRTSLISCSKAALKSLAEPVINMAEIEGLYAHAEAVKIRLRR